VEIYFAGIGWVPFEPTSAQPGIKRLGKSTDLGLEVDPSIEVTVQDSSWKKLPDRWWFWFGSFLAGIISAVIIWYFLDNFYLRWFHPSIMTTKLYRRLFRFGRLIGSPARMGDTPYEFAAILGSEIRAITRNSRWEFHLRTVVDDLQSISHAYVYSIFSSSAISKEESRRTRLLWNRLKGKLLLINILYFWHRFFRR